MDISIIFLLGNHFLRFPEFFSICEYFGITPLEFFDKAHNYPALVQKTLDGLKELTDDDLLLVLNLVNRLTKDNSI